MDSVPHVLSARHTLADAMKLMTDTGVNIVLVTAEDGRLEGVAVDSDIRRALLRRMDLSQPIAKALNRSPAVALEGTPLAQVVELHSVHPYVPVVDRDRRPVGLIHTGPRGQHVMPLPNAAVIMAGGRGERMMPLTADRAKPMVPVGDRPMLETIIFHLVAGGVTRIYLSVNYLAEQIRDHFGDGKALGVEIEYLHEDRPLGTAGALSLLGRQEEHPIVVMNGDILSRVNVARLVEFHGQEGADATVAVRNLKFEIPFGVVVIEQGRLVSITEKPATDHFVSAGIYMIEPSVLGLIPAGKRFDMPDLLLAINRRKPRSVACFALSEFWMDVGRPADLDRARVEFANVNANR
jgi:dTDP-glucose pyrophosphorylase